MLIERVRVQDLRSLRAVDWQPAPGFNVLVGDNGTGKTSVLEAVHLLAHARSFRGRVRDGLVRVGALELQVHLQWREPGGRRRGAGLRHSGSQWQARLDGAEVAQLSDLCAALAVVSFEPGSHALVQGGAEHRRRYLDWGLFHVERGAADGGGFLPVWRRYARALKQRNALLRQRGGQGELEAWEHELAQSGEALTRYRQQQVEALQPRVAATLAALLPAAGTLRLALQPGWRSDALALADALLLARERDRQLGHTSLGPHRAELQLAFSALPGREALSRGQAKLVALALLLAQAGQLAELHGAWPVLQLDDLASELDAARRAEVLALLAGSGAQVLITGTDLAALGDLPAPAAVFHVEHGALRLAGGRAH
ncbi:DNA replication/repair protein RecF [Thermomonas flagellata]|uniref:DNA replication/repair protein RecF n=1 Tax=Thermomonas flagellata TaxID=2888524 RepID=UPI001F037F40|nr:DNA replication/repair protein RecF [Thermomonas flagellata]